MKKRDIWILAVILAIPLIVGILIAGIFKFDLGKSDWITLVTSCISTFAAIFLGYMVVFQTENHKKRSEEENQLYQEQAEENRKQDLMLRANPFATLNKIECVGYSNALMTASKETSFNFLTNIDFNNTHTFPEFFFLDLNFLIPQKNILEQIFINSVAITCYKGDINNHNYDEVCNVLLKNYSINNDVTNIKINRLDEANILLYLLFDFRNNDECYIQNDIKSLLNNKEIRWKLKIHYTLSNSFGVMIDYLTYLDFSLIYKSMTSDGFYTYNVFTPSITTYIESNIKIKGEHR